MEETLNKRQIGSLGEEIALQHYIQQGRKLVERNYTIKGGEIDLIMEKNNTLLFIEVKMVNRTKNLHDYITKRKKDHLAYSIARYLKDNPTEKNIQVDFVFVKYKKIIGIYPNERIL